MTTTELLLGEMVLPEEELVECVRVPGSFTNVPVDEDELDEDDEDEEDYDEDYDEDDDEEFDGDEDDD